MWLYVAICRCLTSLLLSVMVESQDARERPAGSPNEEGGGSAKGGDTWKKSEVQHLNLQPGQRLHSAIMSDTVTDIRPSQLYTL